MTSKLSNQSKSRSSRSLLTPKIIIPLILIAIIAACSGYHPIRNYDIWRNLAVGRWISEEQAFPREEFFSFTESGRPWTDYEWLSELIFWWIYTLGNIPGLILYKTILIFLSFLFLYLHCITRGIRPIWTVPILLVPVASLIQFRLLIRPHLHSFFLGAVLLWWLTRTAGIKRLAGVFIIFALWSNLHGGQLGLLILALLLFDSNIRHKIIPIVLVAFAGLLINPYTWKVITPLFDILNAQNPTQLLVAEWATLHPTDMPWLWVYFVISLLLLAVPNRKIRVFDAAVLVVFMVLTMRSIRMVSYLLLFSFPGNTEAVHRILEHEKLRFFRLPAAGIGIIVTAVYVITSMPLGAGVAWQLLPKSASEYVIDKNLKLRAFNDMHQGSFLAWKWYPENHIYMDGRTELFSDLARTERAACENVESWKYFLEGYSIDAAVLDYPKLWRGAPTASMYPLFRFFGWQTVAWDDGGVLMLAPGQSFDEHISTDGYTILDPFIMDPRPYAFSSSENEVFLKELARSLINNPESIRVLYIAGNYHTNAHRPATALEFYRKIESIAPEDPDVHAREAMAWEKLGNYEETLNSWFEQKQHGSESGLVDYHIGRIYLLMGEYDTARSFLETAVGHPGSSPQWEELLARTSTQDAANDVQREIARVEIQADRIAREGVLYLRRNQFDIADSLLQIAVTMMPKGSDLHQNLGVIHASEDRWRQAEAEFREAVSQDESALWARYNLAGLLVESRGDTSQALLQLRMVLGSHPDSTLQHLAATYMNRLEDG